MCVIPTLTFIHTGFLDRLKHVSHTNMEKSHWNSPRYTTAQDVHIIQNWLQIRSIVCTGSHLMSLHKTNEWPLFSHPKHGCYKLPHIRARQFVSFVAWLHTKHEFKSTDVWSAWRSSYVVLEVAWRLIWFQNLCSWMYCIFWKVPDQERGTKEFPNMVYVPWNTEDHHQREKNMGHHGDIAKNRTSL